MNRHHHPVTVAFAALVLTACTSGTAQPAPSTTPPRPTVLATGSVPVSTTESSSPTTAPPGRIEPDRPVGVEQLAAAPSGLGPRFATSDAPLPAQTTGALHDAGGQALPVEPTLEAFGIHGLPRPSGTHSAVMELDVTATRLGGTDGTSLSTEVLYMVTTPTPIGDLLVDAARTLVFEPSSPSITVPDYDGTTGDPRCARLPLDTGDHVAMSVEGCQYRAEPLTEVRSIGFRRLNLLIAGPPNLPPVFGAVPDELLAAGDLAGYTATFGRPTGPSGNTVQLRVQVHLDAPLPELGAGWQADGPGRWWSDTATITVDAGTATWQSSTRAPA